MSSDAGSTNDEASSPSVADLFASNESYQRAQPVSPKTRDLLEARGLMPGKKALSERPAFGVFVLSVITLGLYIPFWQLLAQREMLVSRDQPKSRLDGPFWFCLAWAGTAAYWIGTNDAPEFGIYDGWGARAAAMGFLAILFMYSASFVNTQIESPMRAIMGNEMETPSGAEFFAGLFLVTCGFIGDGEVYCIGLALIVMAAWAANAQSSLNFITEQLNLESARARKGEGDVSDSYGKGMPWTAAEAANQAHAFSVNANAATTTMPRPSKTQSQPESPYQPRSTRTQALFPQPARSMADLIAKLDHNEVKPMEAFPKRRKVWFHLWLLFMTLGLYWLWILPRLLRELPEHKRTFVTESVGFRLSVSLAVSIGIATLVAFSMRSIAEATRLDLQLVETPLQYPRLMFGVLTFYLCFGVSITWYLMVVTKRIRDFASMLGDYDCIARLPSRGLLFVGAVLSAPAVYLLGFFQVNVLVQCLQTMNAMADRLKKLDPVGSQTL